MKRGKAMSLNRKAEEACEPTLILDGMALRRAGASAHEDLMQVKDLDGRPVNGCCF
jgi:hypothetical protein